MKEHKNDKYLVLEVKKELFRVLKFSFYKDDIDVAVSYKAAIDSNIEFYEKQVDRNNTFCKEVSK